MSYWDVKNLSSENFKCLYGVRPEKFKQTVELVRCIIYLDAPVQAPILVYPTPAEI
jgi:hypothetical protein